MTLVCYCAGFEKGGGGGGGGGGGISEHRGQLLYASRHREFKHTEPDLQGYRHGQRTSWSSSSSVRRLNAKRLKMSGVLRNAARYCRKKSLLPLNIAQRAASAL